jgi:hypothetical protein
VWTVAKLNLRNVKGAYAWTAGLAACLFIQTGIKTVMAMRGYNMTDNLEISFGSFLFALPVLAAITVPVANFRRVANLGGRRGVFLWGSLATYAVLAGAVAVANTVVVYAVDAPLRATGYFDGVVNVIDVFGWTAAGPVAAALRQFAFLLMAAAVVHVMAAAQDKWYGWAADVAVVAVIAVFTPIAPLRRALVWFFDRVIFDPNAWAQIACCLLLAAVFYALSRPVFTRKPI